MIMNNKFNITTHTTTTATNNNDDDDDTVEQLVVWCLYLSCRRDICCAELCAGGLKTGRSPRC